MLGPVILHEFSRVVSICADKVVRLVPCCHPGPQGVRAWVQNLAPSARCLQRGLSLWCEWIHSTISANAMAHFHPSSHTSP